MSIDCDAAIRGQQYVVQDADVFQRRVGRGDRCEPHAKRDSREIDSVRVRRRVQSFATRSERNREILKRRIRGVRERDGCRDSGDFLVADERVAVDCGHLVFQCGFREIEGSLRAVLIVSTVNAGDSFAEREHSSLHAVGIRFVFDFVFGAGEED